MDSNRESRGVRGIRDWVSNGEKDTINSGSICAMLWCSAKRQSTRSKINTYNLSTLTSNFANRIGSKSIMKGRDENQC